MSLVVKYSESPVKLMENQKLVEIEFPNSATEIIGLKTDNLTKIDVTKCSKDFVNTVKSNYSEKPNNVGGSIEVVDQIPNNEIWYEASEKLTETTTNSESGLHTNASFGATMLSHTFENGKGVIIFDGNVTNIGFSAFQNCKGLTSIIIPNSVIYIHGSAFGLCSGLTSINIPNDVTSIDLYAFASTGLTSVEIPNSVKSLYTSVFAGCKKLTSITIPEGLTFLGDNVFYQCSGVTSITIPNRVTSIGNSTFGNCTGLSSITIGNGVKSMGSSPFYGCTGLTSIVVNSGNTVYDSRNNCNAIIKTSTNELITGCKNTVIPDSVTSIGSYAFKDCSGLTSINIPNSVKSIGNCAFYGCIYEA